MTTTTKSVNLGTLAFLGCGTMGEAILKGLLSKGDIAASQIWATDVMPDRLSFLKKTYGLHATSDNCAAAKAADTILLCIKPFQIESLLQDKNLLAALEGKTVVSIAAGIRLGQLESWLPKTTTVIRAMPNTPCLIGEGMTSLSHAPSADSQRIGIIRSVFDAVGMTAVVDESKMDVVTALAGSGPAFIYLAIESLADGAVRKGLPKDLALRMAAQMVQGTARMVTETESHPAVLKDQVTTPGGCTAAGLSALEDGSLRAVLADAIERAADKAAQMG